jgi:hypothetical protein
MAKKIKGLGDLVATVTDALGIEKCNNCEQRQALGNVNFAFRKPKPLTDEQRLIIDTEPLKVYNECFGMDIDESLFKDGVKTAILKKLNILKTYEN